MDLGAEPFWGAMTRRDLRFAPIMTPEGSPCFFSLTDLHPAVEATKRAQ